MTILGSHSETEELGQGRYRLTQHLRRIAYDTGGGRLRRLESKLKASGDQDRPLGVDELVQFRLADRLGRGQPVVHFGHGGRSIQITPQDTHAVDGELVKGATGYRYNGAWDGADLEYLLGGHLVRKNIYLHAKQPARFEFLVDNAPGLNESKLDNDAFRLLDPVLLNPATGRFVALNWSKARKGGKLLLGVDLPAGDWDGWVLDPTLALQPDATDGQDVVIDSPNPTTNYGTLGALYVGESNAATGTDRALIKFNLTNLPSNAVLSAVTFSLYQGSEASSNARTLRVYRTKRAWAEAQATWNIYSTGNSWSTAGGFHADDCEQTDIGSRAFSATETSLQFKDWSLTPTTKAALDLGNGWLVKADTETNDQYQFESSDVVTAANRPKLNITYTVPSGMLLMGVG